MATIKRKQTRKTGIRKARPSWRATTRSKHTPAQPEGKSEAKPAATAPRGYFQVVVRPTEDFTQFHFRDVGKDGHVMRLAGKTHSGPWDTQAYLISKSSAHQEGDTLVADCAATRKVFKSLGSEPRHVRGDLFKVQQQPAIPEDKKPGDTQMTNWLDDIIEAQNSRRKRTTR